VCAYLTRLSATSLAVLA